MEEFEMIEEILTSEETPSVEETLPPEPPSGALRKEANVQGGALLIYHVILNFAVIVVVFAAAFIKALEQVFGSNMDMQDIIDSVMSAAGWGYLFAVAIGFVALLLWKKPQYLRLTIWKKGEPMTFGGFFALLSLMMSAQMIAQVCNLGLGWMLDLMGLDGDALQQLADVDTDSLSMFLYIGIVAPISEELLFRGLLLRSIAPYGKKLAVIGSAILFGLYHANPIQTPYAILVGLVLGYVALEYHVIWAIAMHVFNNLVFAMLLPKALSFLPVVIIDWILWAVIIAFFIAALLILLAKRYEVAALWRSERLERWQRVSFFRAPTIVVLIILCLINTAATMLLLFLQ